VIVRATKMTTKLQMMETRTVATTREERARKQALMKTKQKKRLQ